MGLNFKRPFSKDRSKAGKYFSFTQALDHLKIFSLKTVPWKNKIDLPHRKRTNVLRLFYDSLYLVRVASGFARKSFINKCFKFFKKIVSWFFYLFICLFVISMFLKFFLKFLIQIFKSWKLPKNKRSMLGQIQGMKKMDQVQDQKDIIFTSSWSQPQKLKVFGNK